MCFTCRVLMEKRGCLSAFAKGTCLLLPPSPSHTMVPKWALGCSFSALLSPILLSFALLCKLEAVPGSARRGCRRLPSCCSSAAAAPEACCWPGMRFAGRDDRCNALGGQARVRGRAGCAAGGTVVLPINHCLAVCLHQC